MEALDVVEDVGPGVGHGQVPTSVDPLALKHAEKALGRGVVPAVADVAQAQGDVVVLQELLVLVGRELPRFKGSSQQYRV